MATTKKHQTKFTKWINKKGTVALAKQLKTTDSVIRVWRTGRSIPKARTMKEIITLTRGKISYKDIVEHYLNSDYRNR